VGQFVFDYLQISLENLKNECLKVFRQSHYKHLIFQLFGWPGLNWIFKNVYSGQKIHIFISKNAIYLFWASEKDV
jgi:hypothetical protein